MTHLQIGIPVQKPGLGASLTSDRMLFSMSGELRDV